MSDYYEFEDFDSEFGAEFDDFANAEELDALIALLNTVGTVPTVLAYMLGADSLGGMLGFVHVDCLNRVDIAGTARHTGALDFMAQPLMSNSGITSSDEIYCQVCLEEGQYPSDALIDLSSIL